MLCQPRNSEGITCVLSSISVVICFQERQMREHQETYLLPSQMEGSMLPRLMEGHADFLHPSITDLHGEKLYRPSLSGTKLARASRPPQNNCPMSPPCSACLGHEPWLPYLTHTKPPQCLPKNSQETEHQGHCVPQQLPQDWFPVTPLHPSDQPKSFVHPEIIWPNVLPSARES